VIRIPALGLLRRRLGDRDWVVVSGRIAEMNPEDQDEEGVLHQIITVAVDEVLADEKRSGVSVGEIVLIAIRYGDPSGFAHPVAGLAEGEAITICGVYVPAEEAYEQPGGEQMSVIHFTHRPMGWVEYRGQRYA
jgi:hypothetical protein